MGKKRTQVRQVRQTMRKVKPKSSPAAPSDQKGGGPSRKQREKFITAGGMLQGYAPDFVVRVGYYSLAVSVVCVLVIAGLLLFMHGPYGWPDAVAACVGWLLPIALLASFVIPGYRLAMKDRTADAKLVQGQLVGASSVSTAIGLGMLMVQTRGGMEQYLVPPEKLKQVPGNQVNVVLTVTPNLRHVRSVGVMGQRMVGRAEPPVPAVLKRLQLLPLATPIALCLAAIVGSDVIALIPFSDNSAVHASVAIATGAVLAAGVYGISYLLQRRMMSEVQALTPKGV